MAQQVPQAGQQKLVAVAGTRCVSRSGQDLHRPGPGDGLDSAPPDVPASVSMGRFNRRRSATSICASRRSGVSSPDLLASAQRLDDRLEVEEVVARQGALGEQRPFQAAEHADAEVVEDAAVRVRLPAELADVGADVGAGQLQRREEPGEGRRGGDGHRHGRQADVDAVDAERCRPAAGAPSAGRRG